MKGWKKLHHAYTNQKKAGTAMLIADKVDFRAKYIRKQEDYFTTTEGSVHQNT